VDLISDFGVLTMILIVAARGMVAYRMWHLMRGDSTWTGPSRSDSLHLAVVVGAILVLTTWMVVRGPDLLGALCVTLGALYLLLVAAAR
jgi:hypothetical protein